MRGIDTEKPFAIQNSTHFCGFFDDEHQAEEHLKACRVAREDSYVAKLYGSPTVPCNICPSEYLERYKKSFRVTFPWGAPDGEVSYDILVIQYLDYAKTAQENN